MSRRSLPSPRRSPASVVQGIARLVLASTSACTMALLASCGGQPQAPQVDDSVRRPVNAPGVIEQHRCRADLSAARAALVEASNQTARAAAEARIARAQPQPTSHCDARPGTGSNTVFVVPFAVGSAQWQLDAASGARIRDAARSAELVLVRGRSDGAVDAPTETALARRRAEAAAGWLRGAGVDAGRLQLQWQGGAVVSTFADTHSLRRAEIEVYGAAPAVIAPGSPPMATASASAVASRQGN